jgi:DNA-binding protein
MSKDNDEIKSLVDQLKDNTIVNNSIQQTSEEFRLDKDDIEDFVVQNSGKLINESLDVMNNVKDYIMASGDPDSISALSELIRASSGAIESLNKIVIQNKRSATSLATKKMDIDSKVAIEEKKSDALIGTREEMFKKILDQAKVVDVNVAEPNLDQTPEPDPPAK